MLDDLLTRAATLLADHHPEVVPADMGYDSKASITAVESCGDKAELPPKKNRVESRP